MGNTLEFIINVIKIFLNFQNVQEVIILVQFRVHLNSIFLNNSVTNHAKSPQSKNCGENTQCLENTNFNV